MHDIAKQVVDALRINQQTICFAESCTGGLISETITRVPGASEVFLGSVVAYANEVKKNILGVDKKLLETYGAVSEQVAYAMAENTRKLFSADWSISVTGIAGPSGGSQEKPVGTVFVGISSKNKTQVNRLNLGNIGRDAVRDETTKIALHWVFDYLT